MSADREEVILTVPSELTKKCPGVALDMGGSALKFVFRTKEDVDNADSDGSKLSRLHLVMFGRQEFQEGLEYVKQRAYIHTDGSSSEPTAIYTTGVGAMEFGKVISQELNVRLQTLTEFDVFVKSFSYLVQHLPRSAVLEPFDVNALAEPIEQAKGQAQFFASAQSNNLTAGVNLDLLASVEEKISSLTGRPPADAVQPPVDAPLSEAEADMFPCILAMIGSGFGLIKVQKDSTFQVIDGSNRAGRSFCGIGRLLTGCKTFDELISLAEKGDYHQVDMFSSDFIKSEASDEGDSIYKLATKARPHHIPSLVYCFGKVAGNDDEFKREDVARAWLNYLVLDIVQVTYATCRLNDVKRVFFCGGFCSHPLVRHVITTEMVRRNLFLSFMSQNPAVVEFDFVKPGQHLGALGCMVKGMEQSSAGQ